MQGCCERKEMLERELPSNLAQPVGRRAINDHHLAAYLRRGRQSTVFQSV